MSTLKVLGRFPPSGLTSGPVPLASWRPASPGIGSTPSNLCGCLTIEGAMSGFESLHLSAPLAAALEALGLQADDPAVREAVPTAARGHNLLLVAPPAACHAVPTLAGMLSGCAAGNTRGLLLCPDAALQEWSVTLAPLARAGGFTLHAATGLSRTTRHLRDAGIDLLLASPAVALALLRRSALKMESVSHLVLAWPELFEDGDALASLMLDLPKETQRIILSFRPERTADLVERYARRAMTAGQFPVEKETRPVRVVSVSWGRRAGSIPVLLELLDPGSVSVWAADRAGADAVARALSPGETAVRIFTESVEPADLVIAYDLPTPERLHQLTSVGPVVLLVPPHTMPYLEFIAAERRPLLLPGVLERVNDEHATRRQVIGKLLEGQPQEAALLALAPLFERHEPALVAAALYALWTERVPTATPSGTPDVPATSRLWVSIGKKDGATPHDLVAVLTKEVRVGRSSIGKVDVRELYTLVELPVQEVERAAAAMNGLTIRKRRVSAKVDQGGKR